MDAATEQKVLATLYDRLFDAITYAPGGSRAPAFDPSTTFVQFAKMQAINPADFANMATPANPQGSMLATEQFSRFVDAAPALSVEYVPTTTRISGVYGSVVAKANSAVQTDPKQLEIYHKAYDFLNRETTLTDFTGKTTTTTGPSPIYNAYQNNRLAYTAALSAYRTAYLNYDMTNPSQQRQWLANAPLLQAAIDKTWNDWRAQGAAQVEQALAALDTTVNSSIRELFASAQATMANAGQASLIPGTQDKWYLAYPTPSDFAEPLGAAGLGTLTLRSSQLNQTASSTFSKFGGSGGYNAGLWSVGASASHSSAQNQQHSDAQNFELSVDLGIVRITRPWLNGLLFRAGGWFTDAFPTPGAISNGKLEGNERSALPLIPTAFVVARNLRIKADWGSEDRSHVEQATSGSASVGWGPFQLSGSYASGSSSDSYQAKLDGGALVVPGIQVVAWINEVVPRSAPLAAPA